VPNWPAPITLMDTSQNPPIMVLLHFALQKTEVDTKAFTELCYR